MVFFKANPTKLLLAFALILDKNKGGFDSRAVALAYAEIGECLFAKSLSVLSKRNFFKILDFFYERSTDERIKKMPKDKFFKKYFKFLLKKGILKVSDITSTLKEYEIAIFILNNEILIITEVQTFNESKEFIGV
jgi:hypothetical protein